MPHKKISELLYASKISAKLNNTAIQDGYALYHHAIFFDEEGNWTVVQQGMNSDIKMARRYHWNSEKAASSFVSEPHSGIICNKAHQRVLNMTASESIETQKNIIGSYTRESTKPNFFD